MQWCDRLIVPGCAGLQPAGTDEASMLVEDGRPAASLTERLQETAIPGPSPWTWRAGPAEPRCSSTEASVPAMRFAVRVAASSSEVVEVACEARRGRFSARGRIPGAKLEIGVKGACVGDLPASPAATAAAAVQLCPQEESSVEEALFSLCVGGLSPRGRAVGHLNVRRGLTPPGPTALQQAVGPLR